MVYNNVLEALGHTPLIRLNCIPDAQCAEVLVKYEAVNIGGSIKTRTAYNRFREAERRGDITKDTLSWNLPVAIRELDYLWLARYAVIRFELLCLTV